MHDRKWGKLSVVAVALIIMGTAFTVFANPAGGILSVSELLEGILIELQSLNANLTAKDPCCPSVENPRQEEGLINGPAEGSEHTLVSISGPGKFVSARMTKQGGASGITFASLVLDGEVIEQRSFAAIKNWGLIVHNPFGVAVLTSASGIDAFTIGFPQPLAFESSLELRATVNEPGVVQMIGTVIVGD